MSVSVPKDSGAFERAWFILFGQMAAILNIIASEDGDTIRAAQFTDATRPAALAAADAGTMIFNSDDGMLNVWDGTQWTLPDGTAT